MLLWAGDMDLFQAVNYSLTTMSTGGFGTEATSITGFSPYTPMGDHRVHGHGGSLFLPPLPGASQPHPVFTA